MKLIANPVEATNIFIAILVVALLATIRKQKTKDFFSLDTTQELKGFAILAVVLSHIGYFLVEDHRFLFPLSTIAGVGVDIFLILSGYGLVMSGLKKDLTIWQFYKSRLIRLFVPMWITLLVFFPASHFVRGLSYSWSYIFQSFLGIFRTADLYRDINSPLWYFSFILFFYLLFPLFFYKKRPYLSAIGLYLIAWLLLKMDLFGLSHNLFMYRIHLAAFPIGMLFASIVSSSATWLEPIKNIFFQFGTKIKMFNSRPTFLEALKKVLYYLSFSGSIGIFLYLFSHSGVGRGITIEQTLSILTAFSVIIVFLLKRFDIKLLYIFGFYSYEIYLFHWPFLYSYDIFYQYFPGYLATTFYLIFFVGLGMGLQRLSKIVVAKI